PAVPGATAVFRFQGRSGGRRGLLLDVGPAPRLVVFRPPAASRLAAASGRTTRRLVALQRPPAHLGVAAPGALDLPPVEQEAGPGRLRHLALARRGALPRKPAVLPVRQHRLQRPSAGGLVAAGRPLLRDVRRAGGVRPAAAASLA